MIKLELLDDRKVIEMHKSAFSTELAAALDLLMSGDTARIEHSLARVYPNGIPKECQVSISSKEWKSYIEFVSKEHAASDLTIADASTLCDIVSKDITQFKLTKADDAVRNCRKVLRDVFSYDSFREGRPLNVDNGEIIWGAEWSSGWDALKLMQALDVSVCPYCNAETVCAVEIKNKKGIRIKVVRSAFDHFFCRKFFPYLGLSLFNLVPSCSRCNTSLKGRRVMYPDLAMSPYQDSMGEYAEFVIESGDIASVSEESPKGTLMLGLDYKNVHKLKAAKNARHMLDDVFKTKTIYNELYYREASSIVYRARNLSVLGAKLYSDMLRGIKPDVLIYGYPLRKESINKYRLAKMTIDLVNFVKQCQRTSARAR